VYIYIELNNPLLLIYLGNESSLIHVREYNLKMNLA
jgi:hypothetical protein